MSGLNRVELIGNLGADPETRYTAGGAAVTTISIATSERWKDKQTGEQKERTEWHRVTFWNRLAEIAGEYLKKGSKVYVAGKLQTDKYTDKEGIERYATKIIAHELLMLSSREGGEQQQQRPRSQQQRPAQRPTQEPAPQGDFEDDDIPF